MLHMDLRMHNNGARPPCRTTLQRDPQENNAPDSPPAQTRCRVSHSRNTWLSMPPPQLRCSASRDAHSQCASDNLWHVVIAWLWVRHCVDGVIIPKELKSELMKPAMLNHPSTVWARKSLRNFHWLFNHGDALCKEYTFRYGKEHGTEKRIVDCASYIDIINNHDYPENELTPVDIAMFDKYRIPSLTPSRTHI